MIKEITEKEFEVETKNKRVVVDFYATWCGPCKMMHPIIEKISQQYPDLKIIKVDVDKHESVAREYSVMSIPTLVLFKDGNVIEKNVGFVPEEQLVKWIQNN